MFRRMGEGVREREVCPCQTKLPIDQLISKKWFIMLKSLSKEFETPSRGIRGVHLKFHFSILKPTKN